MCTLFSARNWAVSSCPASKSTTRLQRSITSFPNFRAYMFDICQSSQSHSMMQDVRTSVTSHRKWGFSSGAPPVMSTVLIEGLHCKFVRLCNILEMVGNRGIPFLQKFHTSLDCLGAIVRSGLGFDVINSFKGSVPRSPYSPSLSSVLIQHGSGDRWGCKASQYWFAECLPSLSQRRSVL